MADIELAAPYYLPIMQEGSEVSFMQGVQKLGGWNNFRDWQEARLTAENETLSAMLQIQAQMVSPYPADKEAAAVTKIVTYGLLAHQAELDAQSGMVTSHGILPVVSRAAIDTFGEGITQEEAWQEYCDRTFRRMFLWNGHLPDVVGLFLSVSGVTSPGQRNAAREIMTFTHAYLDMQATKDTEQTPPSTEEK